MVPQTMPNRLEQMLYVPNVTSLDTKSAVFSPGTLPAIRKTDSGSLPGEAYSAFLLAPSLPLERLLRLVACTEHTSNYSRNGVCANRHSAAAEPRHANG